MIRISLQLSAPIDLFAIVHCKETVDAVDQDP